MAASAIARRRSNPPARVSRPTGISKKAAEGLVRAGQSKTARTVKKASRTKALTYGGAGAIALGIAERFIDNPLPVDAGLLVGIPLVGAGLYMDNATGDSVAMVGLGPLFSGLRNAASTLGAEDAATEGMFDNVAGEFDNL